MLKSWRCNLIAVLQTTKILTTYATNNIINEREICEKNMWLINGEMQSSIESIDEKII